MSTDQTPEQIIESAMHLSPEQRMLIADALIESVPDAEANAELSVFLRERIEAAERGNLSAKTIPEIKHEARLEQ